MDLNQMMEEASHRMALVVVHSIFHHATNLAAQSSSGNQKLALDASSVIWKLDELFGYQFTRQMLDIALGSKEAASQYMSDLAKRIRRNPDGASALLESFKGKVTSGTEGQELKNALLSL